VGRWGSQGVKRWLTSKSAQVGKYRHLHLSEVASAREAGLAELARLVRDAHRDQRERLEELMKRSLDPLDPVAVADPRTYVYPDDLDTITLQGYLGEVLAGLVAENFEPHGEKWAVPAFLFRNHAAASQALERRRQLGGPPRTTPGRTGDDALAFQMGDDDRISAWLFGEAKCSHGHSSSLISDGHAQLNTAIWIPVDLLQLIEVLQLRGEDGDDLWVAALQELFLTDRATAPARSDLFVYVCGRRPKKKGQAGWLSSSRPHQKYRSRRRLEAVEIHLDDFDAVLTTVYPAHTVHRRKRRRRKPKKVG
jgi:hypothetical protein